jgi:hypothetical protein
MSTNYLQKNRQSGMIIASPGSNVDSPVKDHSVNTQFPLLKSFLVKEYTYTFSSNPSPGITNMFSENHDLGYVPASEVYSVVEDTGITTYHLPTSFFDLQFDPDFDAQTVWLNYYVDSTKIQFYVNKIRGDYFNPANENLTNLNGKTFKFKAYIFADPGA